MFRLLSVLIVEKIMGWTWTGPLPVAPKYIMIAVPHTSNWDFPIGIMIRSIMRLDTKYIGKKSLFRFPFGWLFKKLGGYPVDRSKSNNFVQAVVDIFDSKEKFSILIAPEGTRKKVDRLKSGFYHIADGAKVPIIQIKFDFSKKLVTLSEPFFTTGNYDTDLPKLLEFFKGTVAKNPEYALEIP